MKPNCGIRVLAEALNLLKDLLRCVFLVARKRGEPSGRLDPRGRGTPGRVFVEVIVPFGIVRWIPMTGSSPQNLGHQIQTRHDLTPSFPSRNCLSRLSRIAGALVGLTLVNAVRRPGPKGIPKLL